MTGKFTGTEKISNAIISKHQHLVKRKPNEQVSVQYSTIFQSNDDKKMKHSEHPIERN